MRTKALVGLALLLKGGALVMAALAGLINSVDEAPLVLGAGVCLMLLGWWVRSSGR